NRTSAKEVQDGNRNRRKNNGGTIYNEGEWGREEILLINTVQVCLRPRDRFWAIPVPKIDSAFDNLLVPQPSWSPSTTQQLRKLVAAPYLAPI
ncbi:hypothetical protein, partial [Thiolapillus sp.]|uniref:hypothetical protein n=1 Tax=Thiolapillus sp. TaxID=2017437 RepID=UPI003AF8334C